MQEPTTSQSTLRISRVIKAPREKVYDAFLDAEALSKWLPPEGYAGKIHRHEAFVGGSFRMSFISAMNQESSSFGGKYLHLDRPSKIVYLDAFETDNPELRGEMRVTVTFREVGGGNTEVTVMQEGIPGGIQVDDAQRGWASSLQNLARLVERH